MSELLNLYVATRHMPPMNSGGPGAAARLLLQALAGGRCSAESVKCKVLVGERLLSTVNVSAPSDNAPGALRNTGPWQWLENRPDNLALNAAHAVSLAIHNARAWKALDGDLGQQPAVTIAFGSSMGQILTPNRRPGHVKVVLSEHSKGGASKEYAVANPDQADSLLVRRMQRLESKTIRLCDRVIFPSRGAVELFADAHSDVRSDLDNKAVVIHNGIPDPYNSAEKPSNARTGPVILNIAQHVREKGVTMALDGAFEYFAKGLSGQFCNFGASTPLTSTLRTHIQSAPYASRAELKGTVAHAELLTAIRSSWVILSTPEVAVFDLSILEAMALAKPVIATAVGGNIEALGADYSLFASTSSEVAAKLQLLHDHPDYALEVGSKNRSRFLEKFTTESFLDKHLSLCRDLTLQAGRS